MFTIIRIIAFLFTMGSLSLFILYLTRKSLNAFEILSGTLDFSPAVSLLPPKFGSLTGWLGVKHQVIYLLTP